MLSSRSGSILTLFGATIFLLAMVSISINTVDTAGADSFPGAHVALADNAEHTYCFPTGTGAVPAGAQQALYKNSMQYLDAATDMYDTLMGTCTTNTDVNFREITIGGNARGRQQCLQFNLGGSRCLSSNIDVDPGQIFLETAVWYPGGGQPFADNFYMNMSKTIRHEVGHSIGLNNDGSTFLDANAWYLAGLGDFRGCTVSGWVPTDSVWTQYSQHHVAHINAAY